MKVNFIITLLPAALAHSSHHHHSKPYSTGLGTAPYGSGNSTKTFGSSGFLTASTGIAGKTIHSTVVVTPEPQTQTVLESGSGSLNEAGATLPFASSCTQVTVTVTEDATVTVTVSAPEGGASEPTIPTQVPVPTQAGTSSPLKPVTAVPLEASPSTLSPTVKSATTLAVIAAEPSSSSSTPAVADTPKTVSAAPVDAPSSTAPVADASATPVAASTTPVAASTSAAEEASPTASAPASNPSKAPKRGIIVSGDDTNAITAAFANTKVSWLGNWYSGPPPNLTPEMGMEYVPQLYSPKYITDGSWASNAKKGVAAGDKYFMTFGEPLGAGISASEAVDYFLQVMQPYSAQGVKLGTPGNLQNPQDMKWLDDFMEGCLAKGCTIDFVCVHWFWTPGPNGQQDFKNAVGNATARARGRPVWVDNFGATGGRTGQIEFLRNIIPWLEDNDAIQRYGYLAIDRKQGGFLPETGDELSDLGQFYATF